MRKKIVFQLFIITFVCLMATIGIIFVFQAFFFSDFYEYKKEVNLRQRIQEFIEDYNRSNWDYEQYLKEIHKVEIDNGLMIRMSDQKGVPVEVKLYQDLKVHRVTIQTFGKQDFQFYANKYELDNVPLTAGTRVFFSGEFYNNNVAYLYHMSKYIGENEPDFVEVETSYNPQYITGIGTITNIEKTNLSMADLNTLNSYIASTMTESGSLIIQDELLIEDVYPGEIKPLVFNEQFIDSKGDVVNLYATATLQPVSEANSLLLEYFLYILMFVLVLIVIVSIIYSRRVARPLLRLNLTARKMANLDFSVTANVKSKNEIGDIATSLNVLSKNLKKSLNELNQKNNQLQLEIAKEKKQEMIRREFVANVSHELKTPLGVIKGYAEAIKDGINIDRRDEYIDIIMSEVEKTNRLVLDMLSLSKIESPNNNLQLESFNINELIQESADMLDLMANEKSCSIRFDCKPQLVQADKKMINMVLLNLLSNAIKNSYFNKDIEITTNRVNDHVEICVYNRGEHIPKDIQQDIWERFYKIDKSHSPQDKGTGLGLAIVKAIAKKHDSQYGVRNVDGGVIFYITLKGM